MTQPSKHWLALEEIQDRYGWTDQEVFDAVDNGGLRLKDAKTNQDVSLEEFKKDVETHKAYWENKIEITYQATLKPAEKWVYEPERQNNFGFDALNDRRHRSPKKIKKMIQRTPAEKTEAKQTRDNSLEKIYDFVQSSLLPCFRFSSSDAEKIMKAEEAERNQEEANPEDSTKLVPVNVPPSLWAGKTPEAAFEALSTSAYNYSPEVIAYILMEKMPGSKKTEVGRFFYKKEIDNDVEHETTTYREKIDKLLKQCNRCYLLTFNE